MADGNVKVEEVRGDVADLKAQSSDCCSKVKKDMMNLERELGTLNDGMAQIKANLEFIRPARRDASTPDDSQQADLVPI
jgi:hypothetical protein